MSRKDMVRQHFRSGSPAATSVAPPAAAVNVTRNDVPAPGSENFEIRVRETLMVYLGRQGDPYDRGITLRDLIDSGLAIIPPGFTPGGGGGTIPIIPGGGGDNEIDLTPPPAPGAFTATGGLANVFFETEPPTFRMGHGYFVTNIYAAGLQTGGVLPTFDKAIQVYSFTGEVGSWATTPATLWYFWATWVSTDGVESQPAGGTNGVAATTGQDVDRLVAAMTGPGEPFKIVPFDTVLPDGSFVPAGTYTSDAYIHNGFISNAQIGNLAVDNAKIANMNVSKLKAGTISAGEYIRSSNYVPGFSGFNIPSTGFAEFSDVVVRGTINAQTGTIGGAVIAGTYVQSSNYLVPTTGWKLDNAGVIYAHTGINGGSFTGYAWPPAGQSGYHLSASGLLVGNANNGKYFQILNGDVYAPQFSIVNGAATFGGALNAASGTFSGNLSAAGGTFSGALNAATGNYSGTLNAQVVQTANIVGAAVTSVYIAKGDATPTTGPSVNITVTAGDRSIVVFGDVGYGSYGDGDGNFYSTPATAYINITGASSGGGAGRAFAIAAVADPGAGGYTISLTRAVSIPYVLSPYECSLIVLHTRR